MSSLRSEAERDGAGFTLVELAVVIIIIGVLAAFAVPRFRDSVERSRASEAFNYLHSVRAAQERYHARHAGYAAVVSRLDAKLGEPTYFVVGRLEPGGTGSFADSWSLTLTRAGASPGYGEYTIVFTQDGYDASRSTIAMLDAIKPVGAS